MKINYIEYKNLFRFLDEEKADKLIEHYKSFYASHGVKLKIKKRKNNFTEEIIVKIYPINFKQPQELCLENLLERRNHIEVRKSLDLDFTDVYEIIIYN